jgi:hypothetical protein
LICEKLPEALDVNFPISMLLVQWFPSILLFSDHLRRLYEFGLQLHRSRLSHFKA